MDFSDSVEFCETRIGGNKFQHIILQIRLLFVNEELQFIRYCRSRIIVDFLVKTSIMKLNTGFFHIIVFVHDNNTASFISGFNHNVIVAFQVM